jgi:hypothetical protein
LPLAEDLGERTDLAARQPRKALELLAIWERLDRGMAAPVWKPSRYGRIGVWRFARMRQGFRSRRSTAATICAALVPA